MKCSTFTQWDFVHLRGNEIMKFRAKQMRTGNIMLCEVIEAQKEKYYIFSHIQTLLLILSMCI